MKITFWKGVFVAGELNNPATLRAFPKSGPDEKLLKRAGFVMHEPTVCERSKCKACRANIGRRYWSLRMEDATKLRAYCTPTALGVMKEHLTRLAKSRAIDAKIEIPALPGLIYLPYQKAGIAYALQRKDTLFGDDMGLGKSIQALGFANYTKPKSILIVGPATLALNWVIEAKKWLVEDYEVIIPRTGSDEIPANTDHNLLVITNYEKAGGFQKKIENDKGEVKLVRYDTILSKSLKRHWDLGIYDEAHALKNPETLRCKAVLGTGGLYDHCARNLFLSGTPMENRPLEIWPIAAAICPARFGDWWAFARRYCGLHQERRGSRSVWVANGDSHHYELQQRLRTSFMVRRLKSDVLKELPPKRRQLVILDDHNVDWNLYPEFKRWKELYESKYDVALSRLEAARTLEEYRAAARELDAVTIPFVEASEMRHKTGLLKLPACLRYTDDMLASGLDSLVIFAHHKDILQEIYKHYGEDKACVMYGDTPQKDRIPMVEKFQQGAWKIFIGGLRAAGVGITLTRSSTVLFVESDWNPAVVIQAEDRLARIGQKRMVHVIHPVLNGSIDANMTQKMLKKQEVIDKILDRFPEFKSQTHESQTHESQTRESQTRESQTSIQLTLV